MREENDSRHHSQDKGHTSRGLDTFLAPVPSLVYMSSALPAFGKHSTRHLKHRVESICADCSPVYCEKNAIKRHQSPCYSREKYLGSGHDVRLKGRPGNHFINSTSSTGPKEGEQGNGLLKCFRMRFSLLYTIKSVITLSYGLRQGRGPATAANRTTLLAGLQLFFLQFRLSL